jgi:TPP-dependent pyruvate/acetoin dehydrogenase alpha subunit
MSKWEEKRPSEDYYQVLKPDGSLDGDAPSFDQKELRRLYSTLILTRVFEEEILRLQRRGEVSIIVQSRGEEATPLGTAAALSAGDWIFPSYRQLSGLFYWDVPMVAVLARLMGVEPETVTGFLQTENVNLESPEINLTPSYTPLAANIPNATGAAMVDAFQENDTVTMTYIGDGSTSEGAFYEGMNFAGVFDVPLVVICQNNQWAISVPAHRQTAADTFASKAEAVGIPHTRVDGNDLFAVYEKTREAVDRARNGGGPTFIECVTYRMRDHNTADEDSVYRSRSEAEYWAERDPVDRFEYFLRERDILTEGGIDEIEADQQQAVDEAIEIAREIPRSDPHHMFEHHLHGQSWQEDHQRRELERELSGENPFTDFSGDGWS